MDNNFNQQNETLGNPESNQSYQEPVTTNNNSSSNSSRLKTTIMIVLGIFLFGGFAFASWYTYENFFATPSLEQLLLKQYEQSEDIDVYKYVLGVDIELKKTEEEGSDPFGLVETVFGDSDELAISANFDGFADKSNLENIKSENNILIAGNDAFGKLDLNTKSIDKMFYLKINDIPAFAENILNKESISNKWINFEINNKTPFTGELQSKMETQSDLSDEEKEVLKEFFSKNEVFEEIKKCEKINLDNRKQINCVFRVKGEKLKDLEAKLKILDEEKYTTTDEEWDSYIGYLRNTEFDLYFSENDLRLREIIVRYSSDSLLKKLVIKSSIDTMATAQEISAPKESISFEELAGMAMGGPSLEEAREKARDARRLSDVKQISTALSLYMVDTKGICPISKEEVVLGQGDYAALCDGGFGPEDCVGRQMFIPANPEPGGMPYTYKSVDGKECIVTFKLEEDAGMLSAGTHNINAEGIFDSVPISTSANIKTDTDGDGLSDEEEKQYFSDPNNPDTDGDGYLDGEEVEAGYSPIGSGVL